MTVQKLILHIAYKLKPILFHILPVSYLRNIKKRMIYRNFEKLEQLQFVPYSAKLYPIGFNLIGSIRAETGLGQSCRLVANELKHSGYPMLIYNYIQVGRIIQKDTSWDSYIEKECKYNINIIHINPHELGMAYMQLDRKIWDGRYNIGFWLWELEEFPDEWLLCLRYMNEIWTPSEFISRGIRRKTSIPVYTIPYSIETEIEEGYTRKDFKLPEEKFLFLMMYDNNSVSERKNPFGVIQAFKQAFSREETRVGLVIKINSPEKQELERLRKVLDGYENIYFITEVLEKKKVNSLIQCVDVVVSLHRAEGFGLVLAEAMQLGTPSIATNWSSNTEFMNENVAYMVKYKLVELEKDYGPFKKGQHWAEADLEDAAAGMRKLYEDEKYYQDISEKAKKYIEERLNIKHTTEFIQNRMNEIIGKNKG